MKEPGPRNQLPWMNDHSIVALTPDAYQKYRRMSTFRIDCKNTCRRTNDAWQPGYWRLDGPS
jgi:hypothetical protein